MNLDELAAASPDGQVPAASLPAGWAPSVTYDAVGRATVVTVGVGQPGAESEAWAEDVQSLGVTLDPGTRLRLVEVRVDPAAWVRHGQGEDAVTEAVTRRKYVVEPAGTSIDVDELVAAIGKKRPAVREPVRDGWAYVHAISDWQIGKTAYDAGTGQTVSRILNGLDASVERIKRERKRRPIGTIVIASLGDLCEGATSQAGGTLLASDLTVTEQLRVVRRLLLEHVKAFAPLAERIVIPTAPGNHDEPHRVLNMKPRGHDSFAVEASMQVADALALAGGYGHVEVVTPDVDDLTVTIEAGGTIIGCAHGHQWRSPDKAHAWWAKMGHARHRIGQAHILLSGHFHHLRVIDDSGRLAVTCPTVDPGSPWWDVSNGGGPQAGVLTLLTRDGGWTGLEIL